MMGGRDHCIGAECAGCLNHPDGLPPATNPGRAEPCKHSYVGKDAGAACPMCPPDEPMPKTMFTMDEHTHGLSDPECRYCGWPTDFPTCDDCHGPHNPRVACTGPDKPPTPVGTSPTDEMTLEQFHANPAAAIERSKHGRVYIEGGRVLSTPTIPEDTPVGTQTATQLATELLDCVAYDHANSPENLDESLAAILRCFTQYAQEQATQHEGEAQDRVRILQAQRDSAQDEARDWKRDYLAQRDAYFNQIGARKAAEGRAGDAWETVKMVTRLKLDAQAELEALRARIVGTGDRREIAAETVANWLELNVPVMARDDVINLRTHILAALEMHAQALLAPGDRHPKEDDFGHPV